MGGQGEEHSGRLTSLDPKFSNRLVQAFEVAFVQSDVTTCEPGNQASRFRNARTRTIAGCMGRRIGG